MHYVERKLGVPYRFDKMFSGLFRKGNTEEKRNATIWVRYWAKGTEAKFEPFDQLAREKGLYKTTKIGRGFVGMISAEDTYRLIKDTLPSRPWFLTQAEETGLAPDLENSTR